MIRTSTLFVIAAPLVLGCSGGELPSPSTPDPPSLPAPAALPYVSPTPAPPPAPKPAEKRWTADSDNVPEMFDCLGPNVCPASMEERAKRRAAAAFGCKAEDIQTRARITKGLGVNASRMVFTSKGTVQLQLNAPKPGEAFYVSGCGQKGLLACVWGNRSVHTPEVTYENTEDRLCLWADE